MRVLFRERPRRAVLLPEGRAFKVERRGEEWALTVAWIAIHSAIAVDL
ncbi:MAG: hypothetical protein ABI693_24585 [Bryobacteraceae bacterium]